jgi:hypothetical protein
MYPCKTALTALLLVSTAARAEEADTTTVAAMGGSGVANGFDNNAIYRNSAVMMFSEAYQARADFGFAQGWRLGASLRDSRSSQAGAGLAYTRHRFNPEVTGEEMPGWIPAGAEITNLTTVDTFRLGTGFTDEDRTMALGAGIAWDRKDEELRGVTNTLDVDASVAAHAGSRTTIAVTVHNLIPEQEDTLWGAPAMTVEGGLWVVAADFLGLTGDALWLQETGGYGGRLGAQVGASETLILRAGGSWIDGAWAAAGGFTAYNDQTGLGYALQYDIEAGTFWHTIGIEAAF